PTVAFFQIHANRLLEIRQTDLAVAVTIHGCPPSARFLPDFCCFPCTYYTTYGLLCLEIQGLFHYSVDINYDAGNCLLLDDGEPCVCVQSISLSLLCRWFRVAVL